MVFAATSVAAGCRPRFELADILRAHGPAYRRVHRLPPQHQRVMNAIEVCRTACLGGHREHCDACGFERFAYNSCRNRHYPKCQSLTKAQWLEDRQAELLPVPYFHLVFTLPHEFNDLILAHKRPLLNLLFHAASRTLIQFGENRFRGRVGFTMILHTWDQTLRPHFHLHVLIPAGALAADQSRWIHGDSRFLFAVRALSRVFRGKFLDGLRSLRRRGELTFPNDDATALLDTLHAKSWIVYAKKPFAGPKQALNYLGRYTHRVAISNERILKLEDGVVTFGYRDRARGDVRRTMDLPADRFIGRFLLHVLPRGFMRIRHFGFLANRAKAQALRRCRELLDIKPPLPCRSRTTAEWVLLLNGTDITRCPHCGGQLIREELVGTARHPGRAPPAKLS